MVNLSDHDFNNPPPPNPEPLPDHSPAPLDPPMPIPVHDPIHLSADVPRSPDLEQFLTSPVAEAGQWGQALDTSWQHGAAVSPDQDLFADMGHWPLPPDNSWLEYEQVSPEQGQSANPTEGAQPPDNRGLVNASESPDQGQFTDPGPWQQPPDNLGQGIASGAPDHGHVGNDEHWPLPAETVSLDRTLSSPDQGASVNDGPWPEPPDSLSQPSGEQGSSLGSNTIHAADVDDGNVKAAADDNARPDVESLAGAQNQVTAEIARPSEDAAGYATPPESGLQPHQSAQTSDGSGPASNFLQEPGPHWLEPNWTDSHYGGWAEGFPYLPPDVQVVEDPNSQGTWLITVDAEVVATYRAPDGSEPWVGLQRVDDRLQILVGMPTGANLDSQSSPISQHVDLWPLAPAAPEGGTRSLDTLLRDSDSAERSGHTLHEGPVLPGNLIGSPPTNLSSTRDVSQPSADPHATSRGWGFSDLFLTGLGFLRPTVVSAYSRPTAPAGLPPGLDAMARLTATGSTAGLHLGHEETKYASIAMSAPFAIGAGAGVEVLMGELAIQFAARFPLAATLATGAVYGLNDAPAPESFISTRGVPRLVALDTDAVFNMGLPEIKSQLLPTDRLVVTSNVVEELERHPELRSGLSVANYLASRKIGVAPQVPGVHYSARKLYEYSTANRELLVNRPQVRGQKLPDPPGLGDALNLVEAAGVKADLFLSLDKNTMAPYYGYTGTLIVPFSGPAANAAELRFLIVQRKR